MKKTIIIVAVLLVCAYSQIAIKNYGLCLAFVAAAVIVFLLGWKKRPGKKSAPQQSAQPTPRPAPAPAAAPASTPAPAAPQPSPYELRKANASTMTFTISGVTFNGRQNTLQKIDEFNDDRYIGCSYDLQRDEYKGEPAFKVVAILADEKGTEKEIGFVPSGLVPKVLEIFDRCFDVEVEVYGGQDDKYYGAAATLYYDK